MVEQARPVDAGERLRIADPVPQLDRPLEVAERVGVGVDCCGRIGGLDRSTESFGEVVGREPVVGELGGRAAT